MKSRGTATDKLADVIQVLQIARKTGFLLVTRDGVNNVTEHGTITFQNGQITDASFGHFRGGDAFSRLMAWGTCYFVFQTSPPATTTQNGAMKEFERGKKEAAKGFLPTPGVPYRIQQVNAVLPYFNNLGLTRTHRQLFLLIDGQRSAHKLMQLMGNRLEDVEALLNDLQRAGLIRR